MSLVADPDVAGLLDALGRPGAAEVLRWSRGWPLTAADGAEVAEQLDLALADLSEAQYDMGQLEALLCARCRTKWRSA